MFNMAAAWLLASPVGDLLLAVDPPNPEPKEPPGFGPKVDLFIGWLKWIGLTVGVVGLIICGIMMMAGRRNRSHLAAEGAAGIPWVIAGLSVVFLSTGLVAAVIQ